VVGAGFDDASGVGDSLGLEAYLTTMAPSMGIVVPRTCSSAVQVEVHGTPC
jgi:hypothetical protein